jgi:glycosyltransferase involved in cell wall biosynthesis
MKIVLQHPHRPDEISGVLTSINELLPELRGRPGVEVRLVSTKEDSARAQIAAVLWADAVMLNSNCLLMALVARLFFKRTLLKLHYLQYQTVHLKFEPMPFRRRMVAELRHLHGLRAGPNYYAQSVARLLLRTITAFVVNRVGACSRFCAEQCALPRDVLVLRNPIRVSPGLPPRDLSCLDRPWRFVFIGIVRDKGWETLVDAAGQVAQTGRRFQVDVIGDGPDLPAMKERVAAGGLADCCHFRGRLDSKRTLAALPGALAALMPSRFQEPAGYIPLEAASQRLACIVSRMGGLPETAGPDCPNFAADRADELAQLMIRFLDEPAKALAAGNAAYLRAQEQYSPRLIADELMGILMPGHTPAAR